MLFATPSYAGTRCPPASRYLAQGMLHFLSMLRFRKDDKEITIDELPGKALVSDGKHAYQLDTSMLEKFIDKLISRGYRTVIRR